MRSSPALPHTHAAAGNIVRREAPASISIRDNRTIRFVFSDETCDRYGDIIKADGWQLANYRRNPVIIWNHNADGDPENVIGRCLDVSVIGKQLVGTVEFADHQFAQFVFDMVTQGFINSTSVGFRPLKYKQAPGNSGGLIFEESELLEISIVSVPANPSCVALGAKHGMDEVVVRNFMQRANTSTTADRIERAKIVQNDIRGSFKSFGEFAATIARDAVAGKTRGEHDPRLIRAASGASEGDPTAGGFAVPEQFVQRLIGSIYEESTLGQLVTTDETDKPLGGTKIPAIDETSRVDGSRWGGVRVYWQGEGDQLAGSFPKFKSLKIVPKKLTGLCVVSAELVADVPMLSAHLERVFASEMGFRLDLGILTGSGSGMLQGILNSTALITVPKLVGQASATIVAENVNTMWSAMPAPCRKRAVWIASEDVAAQLDQSAGGFSGIYMPAGSDGISEPRLKGRPLLEVEQASPLGQVGDLVLADLSQYQIVRGPLVSAVSMHARFVNDEVVFRFVVRMDGQPFWTSPITTYNGSGLRSPFVAIGAR
jgi:HK97 family phage major capsid protein/HK97 family phage prohead protease